MRGRNRARRQEFNWQIHTVYWVSHCTRKQVQMVSQFRFSRYTLMASKSLCDSWTVVSIYVLHNSPCSTYSPNDWHTWILGYTSDWWSHLSSVYGWQAALSSLLREQPSLHSTYYINICTHTTTHMFHVKIILPLCILPAVNTPHWKSSLVTHYVNLDELNL